MPKSPTVPCTGCGELMWHHTRTSAPADRRMCRPCRASQRSTRSARRRLIKACAHCGATFTTASRVTRYCSLSCGQASRWAEGRQPPTLVKYHSNEERVAAIRDTWQRKNRKRRALQRGATAEPYTLAEIAVRDACRCGICLLIVDVTGKHRHPDPMSPTIDHIVPISHGGDDTKANVRLAHLGCNIRRSNRGGGEQLMLIG